MDDRDRSKAEAIAYALEQLLRPPLGDVGVRELEIRAVMTPGTRMPEPEPVRVSIGVVREFMRAFGRYEAKGGRGR
jgi:hypothetical protein